MTPTRARNAVSARSAAMSFWRSSGATVRGFMRIACRSWSSSCVMFFGSCTPAAAAAPAPFLSAPLSALERSVPLRSNVL